MLAKSDPRDKLGGSEYFYRRSLSGRALVRAIGVGIAGGILAFYVARIWMQRTPLAPDLAAARRATRKRAPRNQPKHGG
jgi:hypothetical protein